MRSTIFNLSLVLINLNMIRYYFTVLLKAIGIIQGLQVNKICIKKNRNYFT